MYIQETYSLPKFNSSPYAVAHADIIKRFGRFPHRNAILGDVNDVVMMMIMFDIIIDNGDDYGLI